MDSSSAAGAQANSMASLKNVSPEIMEQIIRYLEYVDSRPKVFSRPLIREDVTNEPKYYYRDPQFL